MPEFVHLHVHTQFSLLDGASRIPAMFTKAKSLGMPALAITDHGNMFGVMHFLAEAKKQGVKPIIGCEVYVAEEDRFKKQGKDDRSGHHLILLAKNKIGYHNLARLVSKGYLEGFYYTPRIDKAILKEHAEGLIALSACLGGELPKAIVNKGQEYAEEVVKEFQEMFGDDYYLELQNHGHPEQQQVNEMMFLLSEKFNIPMVATNDVHFIEAEDNDAHHILICLNTGKDFDDTEGLHYTGQEYLKSYEEMEERFPGRPELLANTLKVAEKIEEYSLNKDVILPVFPLPEGFSNPDDYLKYLSFEGAQKRYPEITEEINGRIDFELNVIKGMGYAGYFLIVQDFIAEARRRGILVGPGRGSAAGSAVAYCVGITNIDPIRYNLLFERFLNPERVSMPDIDVDFDDDGREEVIQYVIEKYGEDKVAQIVTFGTMAARSAIRDVARVLRLPLPEADRLAKMVPEDVGIALERAFKDVPSLSQELHEGSDMVRKTLRFANTLEGSVRQTGTHACGVIIGPDPLIEHIPLCTQKDSPIAVTQYDGKFIESVGMLKMDFLGLKTLSIIKDALKTIEERHGVKIDIDQVPLDDPQTFELFQNGDTIGIFQFESDGMQKHLRELKPEGIEDLIAMNALYRPGPMGYIPLYIDRKHGRVKVEYPHELLEGILQNTYGIMVYQEQIMQAAQIMAGFTLGHADSLRKAMGKKDMETMNKQKERFQLGAIEKGITSEKASEVFETMKKFAQYGFNRSHSAAYSVLAYQTAYLKAHYPAEYMSAVLTHSLGDIKKITFNIDACQKQGLRVLGPDVNQSSIYFTPNDRGEVLFGLGAIKGVGEAAAEAIIKERKANGPYRSVFDLAKRIPLRTVNKRCLESMAMAGTFDNFENTHRAQFFHVDGTEGTTFFEKLIKFGAAAQLQKESLQQSLFADFGEVDIPDPALPECEKWSASKQLSHEKEVIGFYISGHPLEQYDLERRYVCRNNASEVRDEMKIFSQRDFTLGVIVSAVQHRVSKKSNRSYGIITVEDYSGSVQFSLFSEPYLRYKHLMVENEFLYIKGDVITRYEGSEEYAYRIKDIRLLSEALDRFVKTVSVVIDINNVEIDDVFIHKFHEIVKSSKGGTKLKINLVNDEDALAFSHPKKYVSPSVFIRSVKELPELKCQFIMQ